MERKAVVVINGDFIIAVHAMVLLYHKYGTVSSDILVENICAYLVRILRVLNKLKKHDLEICVKAE